MYILPSFAWSLKAQNLAPKKVYIADPGIIATSSFSFSRNNGALLENFVFNNLRQSLGKESDLFYFSDKSGSECDFVVLPYTNPSCIQVCWELNLENQDREINGLLKAMDFFKQETGTIITFNTEDIIQIAGKRIDVVPAWKYEFSSKTLPLTPLCLQ
jgi:predicted AAA+ superfamily ATPase